MLKNLCPFKSTELSELVKISADGNFHKLLPSALSDEILLSLGRDLRQLGKTHGNGLSDSSKLTIPIYIISKLAVRKLKGTKSKLSVNFDFEKLDNAFALLETELEKEILGRIFGVTDAVDDDKFLASLDECLAL